MADVCDLADGAIEAEAQRIRDAAAHALKKRELEPNGFCHNPRCCDTLPNPGQVFCDSTCSREYERAKAQGLV